MVGWRLNYFVAVGRQVPEVGKAQTQRIDLSSNWQRHAPGINIAADAWALPGLVEMIAQVAAVNALVKSLLRTMQRSDCSWGARAKPTDFCAMPGKIKSKA